MASVHAIKAEKYWQPSSFPYLMQCIIEQGTDVGGDLRDAGTTWTPLDTT